MSDIDNARRTIKKADDALNACERYFAKQAEMNAQGHMSERVMYPPIHSLISSVRHGIAMFHEAYPEPYAPSGLDEFAADTTHNPENQPVQEELT